MVISHHSSLPKWIGKHQLYTNYPIPVQIQCEPYLSIPFSHAVYYIQNSTNDKHLSDSVMVQTDVPYVLNSERLWIKLQTTYFSIQHAIIHALTFITAVLFES